MALIWLVGLLVLVLGVVAAIVGAAMGLPAPSSGDLQNPQNFLSELGRSMGGILVVAAFIAIAIGGLIQFVAWILALVATGMIARWGWFVALLVLGLLGLQFFVMLAYVIWGPSERGYPQALRPA